MMQPTEMMSSFINTISEEMMSSSDGINDGYRVVAALTEGPTVSEVR